MSERQTGTAIPVVYLGYIHEPGTRGYDAPGAMHVVAVPRTREVVLWLDAARASIDTIVLTRDEAHALCVQLVLAIEALDKAAAAKTSPPRGEWGRI